MIQHDRLKNRKGWHSNWRRVQHLLEERYLLRDEGGRVRESPQDMIQRVSHAVGIAYSGRGQKEWTLKFFEIMASLRFLPNSPTLMNAGKTAGQLSACFVLPIDDSLDSIFDTLKMAAKIHQSGGGTGFSFSRLRPRGSAVQSTHGIASGPVSFMRIYDATTETIKQGGVRRGANMAVLRVDHPDIYEFVRAKRDGKSISNFNLSVGVTDSFMEAVQKRTLWTLRDPRGKVAGKVSAVELFDEIVKSAWMCGDPGLVFLDRVNEFNPTPEVGEMESTNPCGEQPLLPFESCNLGSLNLISYFNGRKFDWEAFRSDIVTAVHFLDRVIDINVYPVRECRTVTLRNRKIGLGVMGFADLLLWMKIPYGSDESLVLADSLMGFLNQEAKRVSAAIAQQRGAFPNWKGSRWDRMGFPRLRNATVSTVAPTGTISLIAGVSSGIEPIFSAVIQRNVMDGEHWVDVHPMRVFLV